MVRALRHGGVALVLSIIFAIPALAEPGETSAEVAKRGMATRRAEIEAIVGPVTSARITNKIGDREELVLVQREANRALADDELKPIPRRTIDWTGNRRERDRVEGVMPEGHFARMLDRKGDREERRKVDADELARNTRRLMMGAFSRETSEGSQADTGLDPRNLIEQGKRQEFRGPNTNDQLKGERQSENNQERAETLDEQRRDAARDRQEERAQTRQDNKLDAALDKKTP